MFVHRQRSWEVPEHLATPRRGLTGAMLNALAGIPAEKLDI